MKKHSARAYNTRLGLWLFAMYLALYAGFVVIAAFRTQWMESRPLGGLNLSVIYGFGLILVAMLLALVYGFLCRNESEEQLPKGTGLDDSVIEGRERT
jgi:uncharacterized membrane protein (DUF485 family)